MRKPDEVILNTFALAEQNPPEEGGLYEWERRFVDQFVSSVLAIREVRPAKEDSEYEQVSDNPSIRMGLVVVEIEKALTEVTGSGAMFSKAPVTGFRRHDLLYERFLRVSF